MAFYVLIFAKNLLKAIAINVELTMLLGPGCSETAEPIAGVSEHFNMVIISYSAEALNLANRAMYPLFFRTIPHILQNGFVTSVKAKLYRLS